MASKLDINLGFYTVRHDETYGWMGGYLLLNPSGRPLEFHCSLPLQPSRTQQVLYGSSLVPWIIGDVMGQAVIGRAKLHADLIVTDRREALELSSMIKTPFAWVPDEQRADVQELHCVNVDDRVVYMPSDQRGPVTEILESLPASFDLSEPFERVQEAFGEATGTSRAAA